MPISFGDLTKATKAYEKLKSSRRLYAEKAIPSKVLSEIMYVNSNTEKEMSETNIQVYTWDEVKQYAEAQARLEREKSIEIISRLEYTISTQNKTIEILSTLIEALKPLNLPKP